MVFQIYINKENNRIIIHNKSHEFNSEEYKGYEFVEEFEGDDWNECSVKINKKYFDKLSKSLYD